MWIYLEIYEDARTLKLKLNHMTAKLILDTAAMQDEFFADTALIGIVSALPPYRFCWTLNNKLDIDFIRVPELDIVLQTNPESQLYFPIYQYNMPVNGTNYLLYKLKNGNETLLPEVRQLDYLWMIQSKSAVEDADTIIRYLRDIPDIQLAQILSAENLKNRMYLVV